jgi:MFS family permease
MRLAPAPRFTTNTSSKTQICCRGCRLSQQQDAAVRTAARSVLPFPSSGQAWYMVFVLMVFYIFSFIDRQIISLLVGPIKRDLGVSDFQVGLLGGLAFAAFYTLFGIPIGRLADRMNRKSIIAVGVVLWSAMATCCGLARNFTQLVLARVGVGVGEATLSPAAYSMLSDAFPREKQGRAFSTYNLGISIGSGIALLVGGLIAAAVYAPGKTFWVPLIGEVRAWQFVFIVTGAPGLLLPLLLLSVREPARRGLIKTDDTAAGAPSQKIPLRDVIRFMLANGHFYSLHFMAMAMMAMLGYAVGQWLPETMARTYGISPAKVGQVLGVSTILINTIGILVAGRICDYLTRRGVTNAPIWVCFGTAVAVVATSSLPAFMPNATLGLVFMCIAGFPFHGYVAMGPMAVNQVTPNQMRAQVSSVYLFTVNLIGMGIGPALVPFISDFILKDEMQIRWALLCVVAGAGTVAAILLWFVRDVYKEKVAATAHWV